VSAIDIDTILSTNGQAPSDTFQVRIGWSDNYPADTTTSTDGVTFDNLIITGGVSNFSPTNIRIDGIERGDVDENSGTGALVGTLTSVDPNPGDSHTYTLVAGA
jgi:hypothetical protein